MTALIFTLCCVLGTAIYVKAVEVTATQSKEAGVAFWAGMKYAHQYNKANAAAAERLTAEDVAASKPKTAKTRTVAKRSAK